MDKGVGNQKMQAAADSPSSLSSESEVSQKGFTGRSPQFKHVARSSASCLAQKPSA